VQRLLATDAQADGATRKRYDKIQMATDRLTALLDDYLTQERIDAIGQGLHLSDASPLKLLQDSAASARALSADHAIRIDTQDLPDTFRCDVDRMRLTLRVLADNAVKYTPAGTQVTLRAQAAPDGIEFIVADDGEGIPDSELPHVFDKFFRGRRASQQTGSGLGLHMARQVVEMHGGTITARNRAEGGAQFRIWLPSEITHRRTTASV
jgi:signal transduction histidine kinase